MSNIEALLDASIDAIDDLPSTEAWPVGAHLVLMKLEVNNKDPKKPMIIGRPTLIETAEQADPEAKAAKPGDQYSFMYGLIKKDTNGERNEFSLSSIKTFYGNPLVEAGKLEANATVKDIVEAYKDGIEMLITTGQRDFNGTMQMTLKSTALTD